MLVSYPKGFWLLGAVFLCTTGAEALYSDLGHCGKDNIRISWVYVKATLILNYLGQGAWLLANYTGKTFPTADANPFYGIIPQAFVLPGVIIATAAAIIASQALITGSFTLISEAMRLNLWPRLKINYPTDAKGQSYIPGVNLLLLIGCVGMVLHFRKSTNMEAAYGLAITLCMIATSILFSNYLVSKRRPAPLIWFYLILYITIEISFLIANLEKFPHGGYVTLLVGGCLFTVMYVWYRARKIKNRYVEFVRLEDYIPLIQELSNDKSVPKYATHLVYMTSANNPKELEHKIIYSILNRKPKRADIYWFVHVDTLDDPYTCEYSVEHIIPNDIIRVEFRLGFRVEARINLMFRKVVMDLVANREVNINSRYESLERNNVVGDFQFHRDGKILEPRQRFARGGKGNHEALFLGERSKPQRGTWLWIGYQLREGGEIPARSVADNQLEIETHQRAKRRGLAGGNDSFKFDMTLAILQKYQPFILAGVFALLYLLEHVFPHRKFEHLAKHDARNIGIGLFNLAISALIGFYLQKWLQFIQIHRVGLLFLFPYLSNFLQIFLGILLIDVLLYGWHALNHRLSFFWQFHRFHHLDENLDASSAVRFHTVEILFSLMLKFIVFALLGIGNWAVLIHGILFVPIVIFHHSNIAFPKKIDQVLKYIIVTPGMHRIHHSNKKEETDSNYSSLLSVWDRLFKTFTRQPKGEIIYGA